MVVAILPEHLRLLQHLLREHVLDIAPHLSNRPAACTAALLRGAVVHLGLLRGSNSTAEGGRAALSSRGICVPGAAQCHGDQKHTEEEGQDAKEDDAGRRGEGVRVLWNATINQLHKK